MKKRLFLFFILLCLTLTMQAQTSWRDSLSARLDTVLCDELLERSQMGMMVWDLTDDMLLYQYQPRQLMRTASTMKALTAVVALDVLGGNYDVKTRLYHTGTISNGVLNGNLVCVGGMDPLFDSTDMKAFAAAVKEKGITTIKGRIVIDCSLKDVEKWGEGWCWDDDNPTMSPLLINCKPSFTAQLVKELRNMKINVTTVSPLPGNLPKDAKLLCIRKHSIGQVLERMMKESDNLFAESLYYQIAASSGKRPATAKEAIKIEMDFFKKIGLDGENYRLADGSGLSLYNYLTPECETMVMRYAWKNQNIYSHLLPSLPIAGVDGTLKKRMIGTYGQGNVRAKTGSVSAVSALTGYLTAANGHMLCFAIMNQGVRRMAEGRQFQDRVCTVLCSPPDIELNLLWKQLDSLYHQ